MKTITFTKTAKQGLVALAIVVVSAATITSCKDKVQTVPVRKQIVSKSVLEGVRLADGMPLTISVSTRWEVQDNKLFEKQFGSAGRYDTLVLTPKQMELASQVSNKYEYVDSVFTTQRQAFIQNLKNHLTKNLSEKGVEVNDVIISKIEFPTTYTAVKERLALQDQELKSIKKQSIINLENAQAQKEQAIAQGEVNVEQAQLDARLAKIQAEMEQSRRASMLASAETEKQVSAKRAEADARRQVLMAEADAKQREMFAQVEADRNKKLNNVEVQKQTDLAMVELEKEKKNEEIAFQANVKLAGLFEENNTYASYLINKELASKVQIAVVPAGQDASVFSGLINNSTVFKK